MASLIGATVLCTQAPRDATQGIVIDGKFDTATDQVLIPVTIGAHVFWCGADSAFSALLALDQGKAIAAGLSISNGRTHI